jgi:uncharacterized protein (TIGR00251 family)
MALIITIKVVPSAGKHQWIVDKTGNLKCYLKSPPERGLANAELIKSLAKALKIPQQDVELIAGDTSRTKKVKIKSALSFERLLSVLGIEQQTTLL